MSDTITEVKAILTAEDRASAIIRNFRAEADRLAKSLTKLASVNLSGLDKAFSTNVLTAMSRAVASTEAAASRAIRGRATLEARTARQRVANEVAVDRARRAADAASAAALRAKFSFVNKMGRQQQQEAQRADREFRQRMRFNTAMGRQQAREARQVEQDRQRAEATADRDAAQTLRRRIAGDRWRFALRDRMERQERVEHNRLRNQVFGRAGDAVDHGRDALRNTTRPVGVAALVGTAAAGAAARRILGSESAIDSAEMSARIYGGLSAEAARSLRDRWAAPLAEALGTGTDKLLNSYVDAVKLGIPTTGAQAFSELATKTSEAWSVLFEGVVEILGTVNTILTAKGATFDVDRLKSVANTVQHLAAKQSTTPEKLLSFMQRGAGGADLLGMSMEAGLAFGSASTSLGNQAAESGRLLDFLAGRIVEMPRLTRKRGDEGDQARDLMRLLGYGSGEAMNRKRRDDPDAFLPDLFERFAKIKSARKREEAIRFLAGREWLGEMGRLVTGPDTYREAAKLAKEAKGLDAIGAVWDLHRLKLSFVFKQFKAGWLNILGEFGKILSPMARKVGDYFLSWSAKLRDGGLSARFRAGLEGLLSGFGFTNLPDLLTGVFGKPGEGAAGSVDTWRAAARGFGAGIHDVVSGIVGAIKSLSGGSGDPETLARWTARILTFSAAMVIAGPAIAAIGGLTSAILALGTAAISTWSALKLAGLVGAGAAGGTAAAGAGAGAAAAGGALTVVGIAIGAAIVEGIKRYFTSYLPDFSKPTKDGIREQQGQGWMGKSWNWLLGRGSKVNLDTGEIGGGSGDRGLHGDAGRDRLGARLQPAFSPADDIALNTGRLVRAFESMGARVHLAAIGAPARDVLAGFTGGASNSGSPGAGSDPARSFGRNFSTPGGMSVPGWFGKGSGGGGSASSNPANSTASAAMLDAIAGTESGKAGYDAVLGNGKYGTPAKPVSTMSLDEAFAFGRQIRARHGSSSALGRYQIVGTTMRAAQRALGIPGDAIFDGPMQDRMARWIARNQGLGAWEGLKHNPAAMARARAALAAGGAQDISPATPSGAATGIPGLGGKGQYDGLKVKGTQATAAGGAHLGVTDLARQAQANLPGGVKHFAAFNDRYHAGTRSKHALGLAFDTSLIDPSQSAAAAEAMRAKLRAAGLDDKSFKVIDEYKNPSARSTGGHIHTQFNSKEAAEKYHGYIEAMNKAQATIAEVTARSQEAVKGFSSTGWRPTPPPAAGKLGIPSAAALAGKAQTPTADDLARTMPNRPPGLDQGGSGFRPRENQLPAQTNIVINASHMPPAEMGGHIQRHISEARTYRAHDMEPELT
ncbi:phage tail tape measure protein [Methylobacterium oryzihabitans]|uniref:Phage tail tape measure protein n=1 Tax=Methylobacterium oryzihabitans TaxID=2499852 RepID=A0A437NR38_9HYPH|nr:phage tail tape measure protein [Methylobacterium oryzihabitans]RVU12502.1 phage tail tape measure protein [Methylobacterium oryzihabitans]